MPQPYSPYFAGKRYSVGPQALNDRPAFAMAVGKCMGIWSYVDNEMAGLFGILLTTGSEAAHRVFMILRRWSNQKQALDVAAEAKLDGDALTTYRLLVTEYGSLEAQRNFLAHGCFGNCPDDEDLLFVIDIKHHVLWQADILPKHLQGIIPSDSHEGLKRHMYVYRLADLERLHSDMEALWWDMFNFTGYLRDPDEPLRIEEFRQLFSSARIQQRIAASKQNNVSK